MGTQHYIDRSLVKSFSVSEKDVTIGLPITELEDYVDSIFPGEMRESFKNEIKKKLNVRLKAESNKLESKDPSYRSEVEQNIVGDDFYVFLFCFIKRKNGNNEELIDIAYQFITGKVEVAKACHYKQFLFIKYDKHYDDIPQDYTNFLKEKFNVTPKDLKKYLSDEKKSLTNE
jgi:hypothetical protein